MATAMTLSGQSRYNIRVEDIRVLGVTGVGFSEGEKDYVSRDFGIPVMRGRADLRRTE